MEKNYLTFTLDFNEITFIGTNETQSEYYNNSQYVVVSTYDRDKIDYTYRLDLKGSRIVKKDLGYKELQFSKEENSNIMITFNTDEGKRSIVLKWGVFLDLESGNYSIKKILNRGDYVKREEK